MMPVVRGFNASWGSAACALDAPRGWEYLARAFPDLPLGPTERRNSSEEIITMLKSPSAAACAAAATLALAGLPSGALAQASDPYIGQIMCAGFNFAPRGWAPLNGQLLSIVQNTALFALIGTQYGGDGRTTFALPDMRGRMPMHAGQGPGLAPRTQGESGGNEAVSLSISQMPAHTHGVVPQASAADGTLTNPAGAVLANTKGNSKIYGPAPGSVPMAEMTTNTAGGGSPVTVMPPYVTISCFIAVQGVFPPRD
jgi:microcystin-dependent protein